MQIQIMFRPVFQSSTLSVRRQVVTSTIRAATSVVGNNPTPTYTTATRQASTSTSFVSQLRNSNNNNNNNNKNNSYYGVIGVTTPQSQSLHYHRRWFSDAGGTGGKTGTASTTASEVVDEDNNKDKEDNDADAVAEEDGADDAITEEDEINKLKDDLADMKNQLLRSLAEQENIRSIARNDVKSAKDFSTKSFAKSMLEVADNLDRALESVNTSSTTETPPEIIEESNNATSNDTLKSFVEGIELTNIGLLKALQSNGVEAYCEVPGDEFNPDKHQALMEYVDPTKQSGTIGVVMKKGYTLNKRVLRPAEVGVIKK
jgi:molecular chaperone GrpE